MAWYDARKWEPLENVVCKFDMENGLTKVGWKDGGEIVSLSRVTGARLGKQDWRDVRQWQYLADNPPAPIPLFGKESTAEHLRWWCGDDEVKVMVAYLPEWVRWAAIGNHIYAYEKKPSPHHFAKAWNHPKWGYKVLGTPPPSIARHWRDSLLEVVRENPAPQVNITFATASPAATATLRGFDDTEKPTTIGTWRLKRWCMPLVFEQADEKHTTIKPNGDMEKTVVINGGGVKFTMTYTEPAPRLVTSLDDETATWRLGDEIVEVHRSEVSPNAMLLAIDHDDGVWESVPKFGRIGWTGDWKKLLDVDEVFRNHAADSLIHLPSNWGTKGVSDEV